MNKGEFIKYLESRDLAISTIVTYLKHVSMFFKWVKKEDIQITKPDVLNYLEYLKKIREQQNITRSSRLIALNHYFTFLYKNEQIIDNPCLFLKIRGTNKKMLYKIYTPEELEKLYDSYYQLFVRSYDDSHHRHKWQKQYSALCRERNAVIVSVLFNQGATTKEIERIETDDLNLTKATLKIRGGKRLKNRILPLKAAQIGLFINYQQNIRPQLAEYQAKENEKLFLGLPSVTCKIADNKVSNRIFTPIIKQIKSIDKQFINFQQIRTSLITFWLKTEGLRKAQNLAGHSLISTTEKYTGNNLEDLTNDINKLHPF
jgi:site-specific recombinase XerD